MEQSIKTFAALVISLLAAQQLSIGISSTTRAEEARPTGALYGEVRLAAKIRDRKNKKIRKPTRKGTKEDAILL